MHIIVAPDSFKGTATAAEAAAGLAAGIREELGDATLTTLTMADGGEGTAEVLANAATLRGETVETVTLPSADALGRLCEATYFLNRTNKTAYIDVAAASGLPAVSDAPDALHADTFGTGVLIADAESKGATSIVLGLGGSASTDGGTGILVALGAQPLDARGYALPKGGAPLVNLDQIDTVQLNMKAAMLDITMLADTRCTPVGSPAMYSPQKGAQGQDVALLTGAMLKLCEVTGIDPETESYGAAGAVPVGLTWASQTLWGTRDHVAVTSGARHVAEALGLEARLADASLIITGEGKYDEQSLTGKVVGTIADMAAESGTRLAVAAGVIEDASTLPEGTITAELSALRESESQPMAEQLRAAGRAIAREFSAS